MEGNIEIVYVEKNVYVFVKIDEDFERVWEKDLFMEVFESILKLIYYF